jgi:hypothetical protein
MSSVQATGDFAADAETGRRYAELAVAYARSNELVLSDINIKTFIGETPAQRHRIRVFQPYRPEHATRRDRREPHCLSRAISIIYANKPIYGHSLISKAFLALLQLRLLWLKPKVFLIWVGKIHCWQK